MLWFFFFKQKTAYEMRISDWSSDVCSSDLIWTSRAEHSDLMLLLARTTPKDQVAKRTEGLSVFVVDMREAVGNGLTIRPIRTMVNHSTTEVFFDDLVVPARSEEHTSNSSH